MASLTFKVLLQLRLLMTFSLTQEHLRESSTHGPSFRQHQVMQSIQVLLQCSRPQCSCFHASRPNRTSLGLSMPTRRSLLTTQLDRLGRSKVTELCSRTGTELDLADQTLVVVSISTPVGQIPFSVPQIASRLTRCACCLASRSDRT